MNTTTKISPIRHAIAAALFGTFVSGFAVLPAAAESLDPPQLTVKYADLNLASTQGAAVLYARIRQAAKNVCLQFAGGGLDVYQQRAVCINQAIAGAVSHVNAPALSALYRAKAGKEMPTRVASR